MAFTPPTDLIEGLDFTDKVVLITGAAGGIGRATTEAFLARGAKVAMVDLDEAALRTAAHEIDAPDRLMTLTADVTDDAATAEFVAAVVNAWGTVDVLFNNAGIDGPIKRIEDMTADEFDKVMAVNVRAAWLSLHHVLPHMYAQRSGAVVNTSSIAGHVAGPSPMSGYVASKFAIRGLTHQVAREGAEYGVRANSIHPAQVDTPLLRSVIAQKNPDNPDEVRKAYTASIPLGRFGAVQEIAHLVVFLASDAAGFITGSEYNIDGGRLT